MGSWAEHGAAAVLVPCQCSAVEGGGERAPAETRGAFRPQMSLAVRESFRALLLAPSLKGEVSYGPSEG